MKTFIFCVVWVVVVLGIDYLITGMNDAAVDKFFGVITGAGLVAIVVISSLLRKKAT